MEKEALLLGATGLVGGHLLRVLLDAPDYKRVTILVRKKTGLAHPHLREYIIDFNNMDEHAGLFEADDIYCCLGTTIKQAKTRENFRKVDYEYPLKAARLGAEKGAKQFLIITALGADSRSAIFYNSVKGDIEREVSVLRYKAVHIFRPSLLLGDRKDKRFGESVGSALFRGLSFLLVGPLKKYRAIEARTVALAMLTVSGAGLSGVHIHESHVMQSFSGR